MWTYVIFNNVTLFLYGFAGICQSFSEAYISVTDMESTVAPKFVSRGHLYKAIIGDTIILPCKVQDLGNFTNILVNLQSKIK